MKFLVDEKIQSEGRKLNFIEPGLHDNVELTEIKIDVSPKTNSNYIAFTYTTPDGKKATKTEYEPTGDAELIQKKAPNQAKRIKHIMTKFMPKEQTLIEYDTDNWLKYASTVKAKLDPVIAGVKLKGKFTYDNKNFVTTPNYLPFLERMDVDKTASDYVPLEISSIDKLTRDVADAEVPVINPLDLSPDTTSATKALANDPGVSQDLINAIQAENNGGLPF